MAGFGTTEKAIINAAKFAPLMGKMYQWVFVAIRLMIAMKLHKVFKDTQKHIECDVETIGCARMCHNMFYPMALDRYWQFQIFCVALPSIIFIAYKSKVDMHIKKALEIKKKVDEEIREQLIADAKDRDVKLPDMKKSKVDEIIEEHNIKNMKFNKLQAHVPPKLFLAYYFHVWTRLIIDICFTVYQFRIFIYKFIMPESFTCSEFPCKGGSESDDVPVRCYVDRSIHRTVFINLHFLFTVITMFLAAWDLYSIGFTPVAQAWYRSGEDWTEEYLDKEDPMFYQTKDFQDGFIDSRGVASARQRDLLRQSSRGGFVQSSGVTYRQKSVRRQKSVLYRSASVMN